MSQQKRVKVWQRSLFTSEGGSANSKRLKPVLVQTNLLIEKDLKLKARAAGINMSQVLREGLKKELARLGVSHP